MNFNFLKTIYLIARVSPPYEQRGTGEKTLLILGDSTGYGTGATRRSESLAGLIGSAHPGLTIKNKSENGRTAKELKEDILQLEGSYDTILVQIGANDLLKQSPPAEIVSHIEDIATALKAHTNRVIVLTSGNIGGATRFDEKKRHTYTDFSREYDLLMAASAAEAQSYEFVRLFKEPGVDPFVLEPEIYIAFDGLHPTSAGYRLWFNEFDIVFRNKQ